MPSYEVPRQPSGAKNAVADPAKNSVAPQPSEGGRHPSLDANRVLALQRTAGNGAVSRLLGSRAAPGPPLARWTMPFVTSKSNEELVKDGAAGDVAAIKEITDFARADEDQKLKMVDHLCDQVLVGPRDERALESIWLGFGDQFTRVASANLARWKLSAVRHGRLSERIPAVKTLRTAFVKDIESVARDNLKQNRQFAKDEMARFGIPEDEKAAAAPLTPDRSDEMKRMQDAADVVAALQWSQKSARGATVGYQEYLTGGDAKHWRPVKFDPYQPPPAAAIEFDSYNGTYLYDDFTEQERRISDSSEIPVAKPYAEVKAKHDAADADIAKWLTVYPALSAVTRENEPGVTGDLARAGTPEEARDKLGTALRGLLKDISDTEGKLGGELDPLDLKPIYVRLSTRAAAAQSGTDWAQALPAAIAEDLLRDHDISNALPALGLQLIAHIAFLLAPMSGGASLFLLAAGTAALGVKASISQSQYAAMAQAAKASVVPGTELVAKDQVEHAKALAESDAAAFALAVLILGASLAAAGLKALRARQRPPVTEPEPSKPPAPPAPPAKSPAEIGEELVKANGGSVRKALPKLNEMRLPQEDAATATEAMYKASGRDVSNRAPQPNGDLVLTSRRLGDNQPVNIVTPQGQVSFGRATLSNSGNIKAPISVTNVVPE
jgi:hypothetical protein